MLPFFSSFSRRHAVPIVGSNSHTVIVLCPRRNTRTCLPIFYGYVAVWRKYGSCAVTVLSGRGKSTIKVQRKYAGSKAHVRLKYGKSTVKYGKSTVLYRTFFFLAPTVYIYIEIRETYFSSMVQGLRNVGGVNVQPFLKHSNYWKRTLKMIFKGSGCFQFPKAVVTSTAKDSLRSTERGSLQVLAIL